MLALTQQNVADFMGQDAPQRAADDLVTDVDRPERGVFPKYLGRRGDANDVSVVENDDPIADIRVENNLAQHTVTVAGALALNETLTTCWTVSQSEPCSTGSTRASPHK
jgi:hypothetical protein